MKLEGLKKYITKIVHEEVQKEINKIFITESKSIKTKTKRKPKGVSKTKVIEEHKIFNKIFNTISEYELTAYPKNHFKELDKKLEAFKYSLNFQTYLGENSQVISRYTPHLIAFDFSDQRNQLEEFDRMMKTISSPWRDSRRNAYMSESSGLKRVRVEFSKKHGCPRSSRFNFANSSTIFLSASQFSPRAE